MVVGIDAPEPGEAERIDRLFHALADPTRRDIVRVVLHGEESVSALAQRYPMSFAAVQKHVAVLERAELVRKRRQGREQLVSGDIQTLRGVNQLLDQYEAIWRDRIDRMDEILAETGDETETTSKERNR
jgi:DNA-binding transcriptional ArsR family regulator